MTLQRESLVVDVSDATFAEFVELSARVPIVFDLWAEWCQPCKTLSPIIERVTNEFAGRVLLAKVDVDANPQLAAAFQAQSIPTVVALVNKQPVPLFQGAVPEEQVRQMFEQLLTLAAQHNVTETIEVTGAAVEQEEPLSEHLQAAFDAIERGDYEAAAAAYDAQLAEHAGDADAIAGLAQVNLLRRLQGKTLDEIRQRAAAAPNDVDAQLDVADLDVSGGHVADAFARLLELFAGANDDDRDRIKTRLIELFEVVGSADERVLTARRQLTSLLF